MNYWEGQMNWPLEQGWKCEICKENTGLEWGMVHAQCRCNTCHSQYRMRDKKDEIVTRPISSLKSEYREPWQEIWDRTKTPLEQVPDSEWDKYESVLVTSSTEEIKQTEG